jgi:hypothetical protein
MLSLLCGVGGFQVVDLVTSQHGFDRQDSVSHVITSEWHGCSD